MEIEEIFALICAVPLTIAFVLLMCELHGFDTFKWIGNMQNWLYKRKLKRNDKNRRSNK